MAKTIAIIDVDGTLANTDHRMDYVLDAPQSCGSRAIREDADWDAFWSSLDKDAPYPAIIALCNALYAAGHQVFLFTARPENHRATTEAWLKRHGVQYHRLCMGPAGDGRHTDPQHDVQIKRAMLHANVAHKGDVLFVVEDRASVVALWRSEGLTCLQCAPGRF